MIIKKLIPQGFCYGVISAYNTTLKVIEKNPHKKIYMLGWLVHNEKVIDQLKDKGVIILDDSNTSRYNLINQFNTVDNAMLILSAHGTDANVIKLAQNKGFEIVDLTCKYVYKTHHIIKEKISQGYEIVFIGKINHPETNAILTISPNLHLIQNEDDIKNLSLQDKKIFCTNQTTLSQYKFDHMLDLLKKKYPHIEIVNDICDATKIRQDAVIKMDKEIDICLVIGDNKSSNSKELYELAKTKVEAYLINDIKDVDLDWFKNKHCCAITAGASTPSFLIEQIIKYINQEVNHE